MKKNNIMAMAILAMFGLLAPAPARADSFNVTNQFVNTDAIIGFPTNAPGVGTGKYINVKNYDSVGFYFRYSCPTNQTNAGITVKLTRSWSENPPNYVTNANLICTQNDFEISPLLAIAVPTNGSIALGNGLQNTNIFCFYTNLSSAWVGACNWIGVWQITNQSPYVCWLTNVDCGLVKKTIPIRWP